MENTLTKEERIMFTKFFDMSSGGSEKTAYSVIYIELPMDEACEYFEKKFGLNPNNVTCSCCGPDFYVSEVEGVPKTSGNVLIIRKEEANP